MEVALHSNRRETDKFGGSVVLSNDTLLQKHQSGDFVEVQGALDRETLEDGTFAPHYHLTQIKALAD